MLCRYFLLSLFLFFIILFSKARCHLNASKGCSFLSCSSSCMFILGDRRVRMGNIRGWKDVQFYVTIHMLVMVGICIHLLVSVHCNLMWLFIIVDLMILHCSPSLLAIGILFYIYNPSLLFFFFFFPSFWYSWSCYQIVY